MESTSSALSQLHEAHLEIEVFPVRAWSLLSIRAGTDEQGSRPENGSIGRLCNWPTTVWSCFWLSTVFQRSTR